MADTGIHHDTVVIEETIGVSVSRVYDAFADPTARAAWGAPSDTATFFYEEADFRVGGRDVARCGAKEDPRFRVEARYVDIVPERRVVWTETISDCDKCLAANITTLEFAADGRGTRLKITVQIASFVGPAMIANTKAGHKGSLAGMGRYLQAAKP